MGLPNVALDHLTAVCFKVNPHKRKQLFIYVTSSVTLVLRVNMTYGASSY